MMDYYSTPEITIELEDSAMAADPHSPGYHEPVLVKEIVEYLQPAKGRVIFDGTLGGGGHTRALLEAGATVVAADQDPEALAAAGRELGGYEGRLLMRALRGNVSGLCLPTYILDIPGGQGKVPISGDYVHESASGSYDVVNHRGERFAYVEPPA